MPSQSHGQLLPYLSAQNQQTCNLNKSQAIRLTKKNADENIGVLKNELSITYYQLLRIQHRR